MFAQDVSFFVAFFAGFVSFASPCILPMIPAYISFITGTMNSEERSLGRTVSRSLLFVLGFSIIFVMLGASASFLGRFLVEYKSILNKISGLLIILFGLHMTGILQIPFLYREARFRGPKQAASWVGSILLGMAFAAGWTPCVGTVLSSILLYAGMADTVEKGIYLLSAYSAGLGVPFVLTGIMLHFFGQRVSKWNRYTPLIAKISGGIMVFLGILIFFDLFSKISQFFYTQTWF